jgi:hypothetical protein
VKSCSSDTEGPRSIVVQRLWTRDGSFQPSGATVSFADIQAKVVKGKDIEMQIRPEGLDFKGKMILEVLACS